MSVPGKYNLTVYQNASLRKRFVWRGANRRPVNLTGYTARLQVRLLPDSPVLVELSTANGGIVLYPALGAIEVVMTAAQTAALNFKTAQYDLLLTAPDGVDVIRRLEGKFNVSQGITK